LNQQQDLFCGHNHGKTQPSQADIRFIEKWPENDSQNISPVNVCY